MSLNETAVISGAGWYRRAAARECAALDYRLTLVARTASKFARLVAQFETAKGLRRLTWPTLERANPSMPSWATP